MDDKDIELVNESLRHLRDHFEAQGKVFMIGWYYADNMDSDRCKTHLLGTTAKDSAWLQAVTSWTHEAVEYIDNTRGDTKPY